ncbi:MAG: hypothetical protein Fur003_0560 [Candidatus Dojkabacteria bacterium]
MKMVFVLKFLIEELSKLRLPKKWILNDIKKQLYIVEKNISKTKSSVLGNEGVEASLKQDISYRWEGFSTIQLSSSLTNYLLRVKNDFKGTAFQQSLSGLKDFIQAPFKTVSQYFRDKREGIIFVFDELDDITNVETLLNLVKKLKSLLTQPYISFIFVTTSEVYFEINKVDSTFFNTGNDKYRTIFTNTLYLRRNTSTELDKYLEDVIETENEANIEAFLSTRLLF